MMRILVCGFIFAACQVICSGCASNPDVAGQVLSGILVGIGTGLSAL